MTKPKTKTKNQTLPATTQDTDLEPLQTLAATSEQKAKAAFRRAFPSIPTRARARIVKFLRLLIEGTTCKKAMAQAGLTWGEFTLWKTKNPDLREVYDVADTIKERILQHSRKNALQERGVDGWNEPVWYKGREVGSVRRFSDRCLEMGLKASEPEKYSERYQQPAGAGVVVQFNLTGMPGGDMQINAQPIGPAPHQKQQTSQPQALMEPAKPAKPRKGRKRKSRKATSHAKPTG